MIEAPIEDKTVIAYVTEQFEYSLASLTDPSKRDNIPSEIDLKCMILELIEIVNFLHTNSKSMHLNLAPEHIFVTKDGKLKLAGLSFIKTFTSAEPVSVQFDQLLKVGDVSLVPNLRFSAPEVSQASAMVSAQADIFSIGCLTYYLVALNQGIKDPFLLSLSDPTNMPAHRTECLALDSGKLQKVLSPLSQDL